MEDDVDVWRYAILELHARNDDNDSCTRKVNVTYFDLKLDIKLEKKTVQTYSVFLVCGLHFQTYRLC